MAGIGFLWMIYTKVMPVTAAVGIITMVFVSYFQRSDRKPRDE